MERVYLVPSFRTAKPGQSEALEVLAHIVGSGNNSRLYRTLVVDKRLAVMAGAGYDSGALDMTKFGIYAAPRQGVTLPQLEAAADAVLAEVIGKGVTPEELERAKSRMIADAVYAQDSQMSLARWYGSSLMTGWTVDDVRHWPDRIREVTAEAGAGRRPPVARQAALGHRLSGQGYEPAGGEEIMTRRMAGLLAAALCALALVGVAPAASAMTIEKIVSPSGIEAWLVREHSAPLVVLNYAFHGGSTQDDADKAGTANFAADLLDEGAGDLDGKTYHQRLENHAIELSFNVARDYFRGSLRTLNEHRDEAFDLLHLALTAPRFDADAVERVRGQLMSSLRRDTTNPNSLANSRWWETAFPDHPYGRESKGTLETVPRITVADLRDYVRRAFARNGLTDLDRRRRRRQDRRRIDRSRLRRPAGQERPQAGGRREPAAGSAAASSSISTCRRRWLLSAGRGSRATTPISWPAISSITSSAAAAFPRGSTGKCAKSAGLPMACPTAWSGSGAPRSCSAAPPPAPTAPATRWHHRERNQAHGRRRPDAEELAAAKSYLKGAYALSLDTSDKIAAQLTQIQLDNLGIDYIAAPRRHDRRRHASRTPSGWPSASIAAACWSPWRAGRRG